MFQKLEAVEKRYEELTRKIADPEIIARTSEWTTYMKEHAEIEEVVLKYKEYKKTQESLAEAEEMMKDPEMKELAEEEAKVCLLYTSPSPRDAVGSRMPSSA